MWCGVVAVANSPHGSTVSLLLPLLLLLFSVVTTLVTAMVVLEKLNGDVWETGG